MWVFHPLIVDGPLAQVDRVKVATAAQTANRQVELVEACKMVEWARASADKPAGLATPWAAGPVQVRRKPA
jgi:hypothetical protein